MAIDPIVMQSVVYPLAVMVSGALSGVVVAVVGRGVKKAEGVVNQVFPADQATKINSAIEAVGKMVQYAVSDADTKYVAELKAKGTFDKATAASVKQAVIDDVMANLGPLKDELQGMDVQKIIASAIEHYVSLHPSAARLESFAAPLLGAGLMPLENVASIKPFPVLAPEEVAQQLHSSFDGSVPVSNVVVPNTTSTPTNTAV